MADISRQEGLKITDEAQGWKGTPYMKVGPASVKGSDGGGDCSGSTWKIYCKVALPYEYQPCATFADYSNKTGRFRELARGEARQEGDVLLWPDHMAIASDFTHDKDDATTPRVNASGAHWTQTNDMWTATKPGGHPYEPAKISYFKGGTMPRVFRYQK